MGYRVTLIPGDGIGPEVVEAARRAIDATGIRVEWEVRDMGARPFAETGEALPAATLDSIRATRVALKGPVETPSASGLRSLNLHLRQALDLYANVRPCRTYGGVPSAYEGIDLVVVRENVEGSYTGWEFGMGTVEAKELMRFIEETTGRRVREDSGLSIKAISVFGTERIVRFAFEEARRRGMTLVTAGHKANIMKFSDGLFLEVARRVAADEVARRGAADEVARRGASDHPEVTFEDRIIDALCMQLVQRPERFQAIVLPNMYGDIAAELAAGLIGGTGVAPGGLFGGGADGRDLAVFEATHGTAPRLAGTNRADPVGLILSGAMLLRHVGEQEAGDRLEAAVAEVLADGTHVTEDLRAAGDDRPAAGTFALAEAVIARL